MRALRGFVTVKQSSMPARHEHFFATTGWLRTVLEERTLLAPAFARKKATDPPTKPNPSPINFSLAKYSK